MAVQSLKCKECGQEYGLDARYVCEQCFGPLEVAYDFPSVTREQCLLDQQLVLIQHRRVARWCLGARFKTGS